MGDINRLRGLRYGERAFGERVRGVLSGEIVDERSHYVLSAAANELLKPHLKAKTAAEKAGILSIRQVQRRKNREVLLGENSLVLTKTGYRMVRRDGESGLLTERGVTARDLATG